MVGEVFAATKLEVPALRPGLVAREGLVAMLARPGPHRLALVSAPAGSGKTTLAAQWAASPIEDRAFAWLSLDPEDADPVRFWDGILNAFQRVRPGTVDAARSALRAPRTSLTRTVVPLIVNALAGDPKPLVIMLDDLHVIEDPEALRALATLIERSPATLLVAATTRRDPPLPLARLRARGELLEVRVEELRFSDAEAAAMLRGLGLDVDVEQLQELQARTEGWAAGLQLAGLSLRHRPRGLALEPGGGAHIADYLGEEVLDTQPPTVRSFLLRTSVLERLSGAVCDAVLETTGSAARLEALTDAGMFLVPLDAGRRWFRYHHLFRETLERRLEREQPGASIALNERAAAWYESHGLPSDAIRHALAAGGGADLVAAHWRTYFNQGELATVSGWLAALPEAALQRDPRLWLARAWVALDTGRLEALPEMLATAERGGTADHRAWATLLRAVHDFKRGDLHAAATGVHRARTLRARPDPFWRAVTAVVAGATAYWRGQDAERELVEALATARADGNRLAELYALGYLSLVAAEGGDMTGADERLAEAQTLTTLDPGLDEHFVAHTLHLARAADARRRRAHQDVLADAERALELARRGAGALEEAETLRVLGQARLLSGDEPGSRRALAEARALAATCPDPGRLRQRLEARKPVTVDGPPDELSERELDVLRLLATALSQREIGAELYVSMNTVKTHVKNIFFKLRVGSREEAVSRAKALGLL